MKTKSQKAISSYVMAASLLAGLGLAPAMEAQTDSDSSQFANLAPRIVSTTPKRGAKDVDPSLKEITVTFDRDMDSGMSWTGGGPNFPKLREGQRARWRDKRTCILPVKLVSGHRYRVGINSPSYQNFRGANGLPAAISAITFATSGPRVESKAPEIVSFDPGDGARDVSPSVTELRVTFNVPMARGFSWTGDGPNFPDIPDGRKPYWTDSGKTCVLPVQLKPGWEYALGLNSQSFHGFESAEEVPLEPVVYTFKTGDK